MTDPSPDIVERGLDEIALRNKYGARGVRRHLRSRTFHSLEDEIDALLAENERLRAENQQMRNTRTLHPSQWTCPYVSDDGDGALWCEMRKGHDGPHTWERAALDTGRDDGT